MKFLLLVLFITLVLCLVWRYTCKYLNIPWPSWLSWVLKNPYMLVFCHPDEIAKRSSVASGDNVLDLGCGAGRISIPLARLVGKKGNVTGIDLQKKMIDKAEAYASQTELSKTASFQVFDLLKDDLSGLFDKVVIVENMILGKVDNGLIMRILWIMILRMNCLWRMIVLNIL